MDLETLEALALADDRAAALAHLLPGSEDHDYFRCVHAQHAGKLDDADAILAQWTERHGGGERHERLRLRQLLYRLGDDPARVADDVRDRFGVSHWHEAEVAEVDPSRPTRLAPAAFDPGALLQRALDHSTDLSQVTDDGLHELIARTLDPQRRRALLARLGHTPRAELVELVADDLARGGNDFGSLRVHGELTLAQLHALAARRFELRTHARWIDAVVRRMRPPADVDLALERDAREAYLGELWQFVEPLPPASNSLKAHVLWHLLDTIRRRDALPDAALVAAYLQLPRNAPYVSRSWLAGLRVDQIAQLGADFAHATGLPPAGDDEELVRALLHRNVELAKHYAQWLDREWLDAELAAARLLAGAGDADRATLVLGPARAAALRERIDLAWCAHLPLRFAVDEPVVLEVDVKNVPELVVKVFRIDPLAYFQIHRKELDVDVDLDGLAASHELVLRFDEPAIRRVRRRIGLPSCARAGTYVVDLIGNGRSSRAVIVKGRLRHVVRVGAAGHVVTIVDDDGRPRADARAWIGDREYVPDEHGAFVVPFSTAPGVQPMLLACGDVATVARVALVGEQYALALTVVLDHESLAHGATAKAIARLALTCAGAPASLALLAKATWDITHVDRHGVATTKSQPLALDDGDAAVLEWAVGDDLANVQLAVRGTVTVVSEQREQELVATASFDVAGQHATTEIEALYLARTTAGWIVSALGKTGEPRARRPVTIGLVHRWARTQLNVELSTDERGRVELGELPGVTAIEATLGGHAQRWDVDGARPTVQPIVVRAGADVRVPVPTSRTARELIDDASLVELRAGVPLRHVAAKLVPLASAVAIHGLPAGDYQLALRGVGAVAISIVGGAEVAGSALARHAVVELPRQPAAIGELARDATTLRVTVVGATSRTRVHAIATAFAPKLVQPVPTRFGRGAGRRADRARAALYVSGRDIGDEYRYVLERRGARRHPGLLLERPTLLLNPWARRTTTTDVALARAGGGFAPPGPQMMPAPAAAGRGGGGTATLGRDGGHATHDFLRDPPAVLANLVPDARGVVAIPLAALGHATHLTIVVDDPDGTTIRNLPLADLPLAPRDLRLALALEPDRHATQQRRITALRRGDTLAIDDLATAKVHLLDSVERAHAYLLALRDDATLREFAFVTRWHALADGERRELYSKYACHELHLFLARKDRAFFEAVIRPYLAHKRTKTFVDHYLLGAELAPYLEPAALARLNAVERALLAGRLADGGPSVARLLADEVALAPPSPAIDSALVDALLGAATLDGDHQIETATAAAYEAAAPRAEPTGGFAIAPGGAPPPPAAAAPARARKAKQASGDDALDFDAERRAAQPPHYRAADRTQEWAEHNWWHRTPADSGASAIAPNRLWRDLATHPGGAFLSPWLGLATGSFAEAMCALAVIDLPFVAGAHAIVAEGPRLRITAAADALAGTSQLVDGELATTAAPLVVGQSYVRADDRYDWKDGEQVDKYVDGPFAVGVVYTCLIVLANPTSSRQRVVALAQIPRGSMPVAGARATQTIDVALEPYGTHGHEYSFYFPAAGRYGHFPVHASRAGTIVAAAAGRVLDVGDDRASDPRSWPELSQRGSVADVVAYLGAANLAAIELERVAWRLRDRAAYDAIVGALEQRRAYHDVLWGYALLHRDRPRLRVWLRALAERLLAAGPVLDMPIAQLDAEQLGAYEHLELAPLVNARAHRLGPKLRILNDGLDTQYRRFLDLVAHRRAPTSEDRVAAAAYLLAQDRVDPALAALAPRRSGGDRRAPPARLPRRVRRVHRRQHGARARARRALARRAGRSLAAQVRGAARDARRDRRRGAGDLGSAVTRPAARRARRPPADLRARGRSRRRRRAPPARRPARPALLRDGRRAAVLAPAVRAR